MEYNNKIYNPLLENSTVKHGIPMFDKIEVEHYMPAFVEAIKMARAEVDLIIDSNEEATFENTILGLEYAGEKLSDISALFFNLNNCHTSDKMQQIALEVTPLLTDYSNDISLNEKLFERVQKVYTDSIDSGVAGLDMRLIERNYKGFIRSGAALKGEAKERYREVTKELSNLSLQFEQNLLAATNSYQLHITDESKLGGLPTYVIEMGREAAKECDKEGWMFSLHAPSYVPFMQYSTERELRYELWKAYGSRCFKDKFSNEEILKQIVRLRYEKATILGYESHADYVLEERMAKTPTKVLKFLNSLNEKSLGHAKKEVADISDFAVSKYNFTEPLQGWDFGYYSEKYKEELFDISDEMLKPYLELSKVENGVFMLCEKLYGITFVQNREIPLYHEDVKAFEVFDENGEFISVLLLDYFPRPSKSSGAWMTSYREGCYIKGDRITPIISVVCNFTKPTSTTPSLLTFNELNTLLHEMGHALHGMLTDVKYRSLAGTNVAWDFVELPSQILENWAVEPEFLNLWATHYKTGETIPNELIDKIVKSKNFLACYSSARQLSFGFCDMAWHTLTEKIECSVKMFEKEATSRAQILPSNSEVCSSTAFAHIFSGGYSAGYYSYKWAELLDADAFEMFKKEGIFNRTVAKSFRDNILSKGDSEDAMDLYVKFRGIEPSVDPLIQRMGIEVK